MSIVLPPELALPLEPLLLLLLALLLLPLLPHAATATTEPRTNKPASPFATKNLIQPPLNCGPGRSTSR